MSALGLPSMAIFTPFCTLRERSYKGGWVSSDNIASDNGYYRRQFNWLGTGGAVIPLQHSDDALVNRVVPCGIEYVSFTN
jgi:hypothetical protein